MTDNTQPEAPAALRPIKRFYRGTDCMAENQAGDWVRYEDHVTAAAELLRQRARIEELEAQLSSSGFAAADSQPAQVLDYPPLPDFDTVEQHIYGACRRYITQDMLEPIHNLIRDVIDADRAARITADRQPEPVSSDTLYLLHRLLSNQHTLTSAEFREELTKIVGEATQVEVL